jgi:hypothetical protein
MPIACIALEKGENTVRLSRIVEKLELEQLTPELRSMQSIDVSAGHASDLLSDVLADAPKGGVLVTIQVHMNVIAVSVHAGLATVIFSASRTPDESVREKAIKERIPLYGSKESTFDVVGQLYVAGLRGSNE